MDHGAGSIASHQLLVETRRVEQRGQGTAGGREAGLVGRLGVSPEGSQRGGGGIGRLSSLPQRRLWEARTDSPKGRKDSRKGGREWLGLCAWWVVMGRRCTEGCLVAGGLTMW